MKKTYIQPAMRSKELGTEEMMAGSDLQINNKPGDVQRVQGLVETEDASSSLPKAANVWE